MSIEGKHSYRFVYLKSEKWSNVRLDAIAREKGKCQICSEESISNDAHHIWYPESIWDTTQDHLVVLCRACHNFIHTMMPECKTDDESEGRSNWLKFSNSILVWRKDHMSLFNSTEGIEIVGGPAQLRAELKRLKSIISGNNPIALGVSIDSIREETRQALKSIREAANTFEEKMKHVTKF